jgi:DNA polymerase-3 subunit delta'
MKKNFLLPRANPNLIGQTAAEQQLLQVIFSGRLSHAWLICGPPGIGKATLAFRFAKYLLVNDTNQYSSLSIPNSLYVSPSHPVFRQVAVSSHADLLTVERFLSVGETNSDEVKRSPKELSVEQIRRIPPFLRLTPAKGSWRVVVVDEAEKMNRSGSNAILKILEEPPPLAIILLISNNPGALLPTIRSRCCQIQLHLLSEEEIVTWVAHAMPDIGNTDRRALARLADGSIGRAAMLAQNDGISIWRNLITLLKPLPKQLDLLAVYQLTDHLATHAEYSSYQVTVELLLRWLRQLVRLAATGELPAEVIDGEVENLRRLGMIHGLGHWLSLWDKITELFVHSESVNLDRQQVILQLFTVLETTVR